MARLLMKFGSVCSGIEAASVAWHPLGWKAAWLAEIEPFPSAVLAHHYPDVPNLGDMTKLPDLVASGQVEAPDVFCGGTPCQAFSVAGLRKSLDDARGNLSLTFCEIANAIDSVRADRGEQPAIVFWENVPGVLNTKDNAFGCFLAGLAGEDDPLTAPGGKWTNAGFVLGPKRAVAWRVLDAQYFGVAQRRRRVFVVASAREGFDPAAVLFEFDGVRRDSAPSREAGESPAPCVTAGAANGGAAHGARSGSAKDNLIVPVQAFGGNRTSGSNPQPGDPCHPLAAGAHPPAIAFKTNQTGANGCNWSLDRTHSLSSNELPPAIAFDCKASGMAGFGVGDIASTMRAMGHAGSHSNGGGQLAVAVALRGREGGATAELGDEVQNCLRASGGGGDKPHVLTAMQVRRLTPRECEALQGFPPDYTAIPWRKKPASDCPDGPRYKALGNSWAVPNVRWIGRRIQMHLDGAL